MPSRLKPLQKPRDMVNAHVSTFETSCQQLELIYGGIIIVDGIRDFATMHHRMHKVQVLVKLGGGCLRYRYRRRNKILGLPCIACDPVVPNPDRMRRCRQLKEMIGCAYRRDPDQLEKEEK